MSDRAIHDEASDVAHAPGEVIVTGPDDVAVSMTPEAAAKTGGKLLEHAAAARGKEEADLDLARRAEARRGGGEPKF